MTPKEKAAKEIQCLVSDALKKVREAEKIATEHKIRFDFDVAYGMGGTFWPDEEGDGASWYASSHSC